MNIRHSILKNTAYALLANIFSLVCSFLVTLIVPKVISVESNGYFNLYIFYLQYIGIFCIGWIDGIVLRYAGQYYNDIDKKLIKSEFIIFAIIQLLFAVIVMLLSGNINVEKEQSRVFFLFAIAIILNLPCSFFRYLFQVTDRIPDYSKNILIEKVVYVIGIIIAIVLDKASYEIFICCDLAGKTVALLFILFQSKDILACKGFDFLNSITDGIKNIQCGIKLLIASLTGFFIIGLVRSVIKEHWGIVIFSKLSLSISITNLSMTFVRAFSLVIFPMLKHLDNKKLNELYTTLRNSLSLLLFGILVFYYPIQIILNIWLPQYRDSLVYLALLFPVCIYECKTALLLETYIKALRKETHLMIVNISTVLLGAVLSFISSQLLNNLILTIIIIDVLVAFRSICLEYIISKTIKIRFFRSLILESLLSIMFIIFNSCIQGAKGFLLYLLFYFLYIFMNKKAIAAILARIRNKQ